MTELDRRRAMKQALGGAAAVWAGLQGRRALGAAAPVRRKAVSDQVLLGNTGIKLARMAMGTGTNGVRKTSVQARLGLRGLGALLARGYDQGLNFWDTADQYGTHEHLREGMRQVGKNNVVVLTKTRAETAAEMKADLDRFRRELGRDYIDVVLLHCMVTDAWNKELAGPMEVLSRAREQGIIRAHGVSCHTLGALKTAAREPWVQVDLARINPAQAEMDADPLTVLGVLREMKKAGKAIIGMKIFGAGKLSHDTTSALRYCAANELLDAFTIGFANEHQLDEVIRKFEGVQAA